MGHCGPSTGHLSLNADRSRSAQRQWQPSCLRSTAAGPRALVRKAYLETGRRAELFTSVQYAVQCWVGKTESLNDEKP